MNTLHPGPEHKFAFGLWTIGHRGRDPFGDVVRPPIEPWEFVHRLGDLGGWGVELPRRRSRAARIDARPSATTSSTASARRSTPRAWSCRWRRRTCSGTRRSRTGRSRRAIETSGATPSRRRCGRSTSAPSSAPRSTSSGAVAREPKPSPPSRRSTPWRATGRRSTSCAATSAIVATRRASPSSPSPTSRAATRSCPPSATPWRSSPRSTSPTWSALNPEVAHETMAGLSVYHGVAQAIDAGKLFHIDLNAQQIGRYDQDLRFGSEGLKDAFFLVKLLEESGYDGPRHFDARPYRVEDSEGAWDFARRVHAHLPRPRRQGPTLRRRPADPGRPRRVRRHGAGRRDDRPVHAGRRRRPRRRGVRPRGPGEAGYRNEHLDQLVIDLILGLR